MKSHFLKPIISKDDMDKFEEKELKKQKNIRKVDFIGVCVN